MRFKSIDGILPVCPTAHQHYDIRRFFRRLKSRGGFVNGVAVLFIYDKDDPCKSRIIKEQYMPPPPTKPKAY